MMSINEKDLPLSKMDAQNIGLQLAQGQETFAALVVTQLLNEVYRLQQLLDALTAPPTHCETCGDPFDMDLCIDTDIDAQRLAELIAEGATDDALHLLDRHGHLETTPNIIKNTIANRKAQGALTL